MILVGFSLGGNVVLKLAGELGESAGALIAGLAAVSAPIDLAACARRLCARSNVLYSRRFLSRLEQRIRLKESLTPGLFRLEDLGRVKTIYDFDDLFTARVLRLRHGGQLLRHAVFQSVSGAYPRSQRCWCKPRTTR